MDNNEIRMFMDVKLDIHNKRPDSLKFKQWSRCEVKIEGIKCLPSYLRVAITGCNDNETNVSEEERSESKRCISVSVIVPGVSISLAASRTKKFSYGLFWTQNRKQCYIYFAVETESSCRRHMKWIKKTIKNLELHRQLMLEQNRISRGPVLDSAGMHVKQYGKENVQVSSQPKQEDENSSESLYSALGPLPKIPSYDSNQNDWSRRISHNSEIYEEIFENIDGQPRVSRRVSRGSIASGIYEEMKPSPCAFNSIDEESTELQLGTGLETTPPPLPPLPPPRKRINTFDGQGVLGEIPRSNTNPESELAKKKKYKNVLDNIFGSGRAKRAESVSETQACTAEDIINSITPTKADDDNKATTLIYTNDAAAKRQERSNCPSSALAKSKRNSFSSPDLLKINYMDNFDEKHIVRGALNATNTSSDDLDLGGDSLHNAFLEPSKEVFQLSILHGKISVDSLNVSEKIPNNFNFSAINSSGINLVGSNGAAIPASNQKKNKILIDDLTGYCVMAPIRPKKTQHTSNDKIPTEPTSSGYSTSSYPSASSSSAEDSKALAVKERSTVVAEESAIYEQMLDLHKSAVEPETTEYKSPHQHQVDESVTLSATSASPSVSNITAFTGNLYENLLAVKASQELEQQLPPALLSTSTPTESPQTQPAVQDNQLEEEENFYQTPRKSIISVDEKIPSYYPNSCDTAKTRRHHIMATASPQQAIYSTSPSINATSAAANTAEKHKNASTSVGLRQMVNLKIRGVRKENLYISSPQNILEQRQSGNYPPDTDIKNLQKNGKLHKSLRAGALKIAEHVYTVKHAKQKSSSTDKNLNNNNNETDVVNFPDDMRERLQNELLQFALLQKIDFKFDDARSAADQQSPLEELKPPSPTTKQQPQSTGKERIYENLLHHHLQLRQAENRFVAGTVGDSSTSASAANGINSKLEMHQSCMAGVNTKVPIAAADVVEVADSCSAVAESSGLSGAKKFTSLPRFKKIDFSPLRLRINNVLQRGLQQDF
ncbi:uncharacterized protein LOC128868112 [Anastrepha ludens]|uniref:uncharacterized protein LOC128868112 n=1 Tax=Anastrepha ludens TaxID=28586 RepID=UPI0023B101F8|nr:uncharacterized protein LOC128868112 [Anastrepha ludens]